MLELEKIKAEIRVVARELEQAPSGLSEADLRYLTGAPLHFVPEFQPGIRKSFTYFELAPYEGREFVQNAYRAVLLHRPDPVGESHYVNMLDRGRSKAEVLLRLRYSKEGRMHKISIRFLMPAAVLGGIFSLPGLGFVFRYVKGFILAPLTLQKIQKRQERLRLFYNASQTETRDKLNQIIKELKQGGHI